MKPIGVKKQQEFDFYEAGRHRQRDRKEIDDQLEADEWSASDSYDGGPTDYEFAARDYQHEEDYERDMESNTSIALLDHGYIKLIEAWGSDERIIESARQSTDGAFRGWGPKCECAPDADGGTFRSGCPLHRSTDKVPPGDEKLLRYLYENKHSTPFEMAGAIIEVQAPIFVFREWHRHRTQSYSELSARYTPLPDLYYTPTKERLFENSKTNKQAGRAKGAEELDEDSAKHFLYRLQEGYAHAEEDYQWALNNGIPKELARCIMPVGHYSRMRASANLRNWLGFLTLRQAPNAQWEIRQYADALNKILVEKFPRTMELFNE